MKVLLSGKKGVLLITFQSINFDLGVTRISNLLTVCVKMMLSSRPTHPVPFTPNLPKIDVYHFRYKISVGILMKLFFLLHKCINE